MHVLIVDDHAIVRRGLRQILEEADDLRPTFAEAGSCQEAMTSLAATPCDLVLLDISLPGRNGLDLLKQLHSQLPKIPVLIISMHPEEQYAIRALRLGAAGYLTKESAPEELLLAVRKVLAGGKYVSSHLSELIANEIGGTTTDHPLHESLSNRELQVACMMATGKTVTDIGRELNLSEKTISTYRSRLLAKLGVRNTAEIIAYCLRNNLVT
jgi:two-component system, NarL family, invasion response regulator UvrY